MTITGTPPQASLQEGMHFAAVHHTEVIMWLYTLKVAVSLAAQSILRVIAHRRFSSGCCG
jgi:hypothetical protein